MNLDSKQQVLLALYIEYQKDLPKMDSVKCSSLNMDIDVFNTALGKLSKEGYISGLYAYPADNNKFYEVYTKNVGLTKDGIEYVESKFGIEKEISNEDKLKYIIKKCGVLGLQALKLFGAAALEHINDII